MSTQLRFIRKTSLAPNEYQADFTIVDNDILDALTSEEALAVTTLIPAIYLRLKRSPRDCWEREGVLRLTGNVQGREPMTAWEQLRHLSGVSNSTLSKALKWLHERGIIGYDPRKNGIGIRIFFNRAVASIRHRGEQKNLRLLPAPPQSTPTPPNRTTFKEHDLEDDLEINSSAGAEAKKTSDAPPPNSPTQRSSAPFTIAPAQLGSMQLRNPSSQPLPATIQQAIANLEPKISAAVRREQESTKEWFLKYALPKATRVAQHETYNLLRAYGVIAKSKRLDKSAGETAGALTGEQQKNKITVFLAEACMQFRQLAACALKAGETVLHGVYQQAESELNELHEGSLVNTLPVLAEIEARLEKTEETLTKALWAATADHERVTLHEEALAELQDYQSRMEGIVFDQTVRRRVIAKLRDLRGVPRVSLFYL